MIDRLLEEDYCITLITKKRYKELTHNLQKHTKGSSKYENYCLIEQLPKNKDFYVLENNSYGNETGYEEYCFSIATIYKDICFILTDSGSN